MIRNKFAWNPLLGSMPGAVLAGLLAASCPQAGFAQCQTSAGGSVQVKGPYASPNTTKIHLNETATIVTVGINNLVPGSCTITNLKAWVVYPNNSFQEFTDLITLPAGTLITCPSADPRCMVFTTTYVVHAADVANSLDFHTNWPPGFTSGFSNGGTAKRVQFASAGAALAIDPANGSAVGNASPQLTASLLVLTPCITVTKLCANTCTPYGQPIGFSGIVTNCGDTQLFGVTVSDNPTATVTFGLIQPGNTVQFVNGVSTLNLGEWVRYSGSYTPAGNLCGPFTDTVTAIGADETGFAVTNTATATCHVQVNPTIGLGKDCFKLGSPGTKVLGVGDSYVDVFTVTNTGNVPLQNVVITDNSNVDGLRTFTVGSMAIGATATVVVTNGPVPASACQPGGVSTITDTATVRGDSFCQPPDTVCPPNPPFASAGPVTCSLTVQCPPKICVFKGIICGPQAPVPNPPCNPNQTYLKVDTGVNGAAFCYRVIVQNCSGNGVTLTNVHVVDTQLGALTDFPTTLADGQSWTNTYSKSYAGVSTGATTNVNVVTGTGTGNGITVSTNDTATAIVVPISVRCDTQLSSSFNLNTNGTGNCQVVLPSGSTNTPVQLTLVITNTGMADLSVAISGLPPLVDCADDTTPVVVPNPVTIPAHGSVTIVGCVLVSCGAGLQLPISVQGTAIASATVPCIWNSSGTAITTAVSQCPACVSCAQGLLCRVTGGGVLEPDNTDQSCILMVTTISPMVNGTGLTIDKITHGGQVGAPFSMKDCGEVLGNPCIRGQWEHVRHYKGSGNPRDVVTAFHTTTPKGQFDTLNCACLGCCDPTTGAFIPPVVGPLIKKFALCNPDDHKICGPMPRPSPANAIIITGIGRLTPTTDNGTDKKNTQWVIYRIYIEDRSEPGGNHPGGAVDPSDVYVFQAWYTGINATHKPDFSSIAAAFRAALGADSCAFLDALNSGGLPIGSLPNTTVGGLAADIVDQGPLYSGNHQIHPATGATCQ